jgi:hypothetical protein
MGKSTTSAKQADLINADPPADRPSARDDHEGSRLAP